MVTLPIYENTQKTLSQMYPGSDVVSPRTNIPRWLVSLTWVLLIVTSIFSALIFLIPIKTFQDYGNILEIVIALFCLVSCLNASRVYPGRITLLLAAFAYLGYALSNTFWYLLAIAYDRKDVFFSVAEMGFIGFMFFFIVAFRIEFPVKSSSRTAKVVLGALFGVIAVFVLWSSGLTRVTALLLFHILVAILFLDQAIVYAVYRYPLLFSGVCLWSGALIMYGLREVVISASTWQYILIPSVSPLGLLDFLSIVGPVIVLSFLLIQLGLYSRLCARPD